MFRILFALFAALVPAAAQTAWKLVWSDEFNGPSIDRAKWTYDIGTGSNGWGNAESEYYTDRPENSYIEDGNLVIKAMRDDFGARQYTSARMLTRGKYSFTYGRVEARIQVPFGQGIWPAFWMLGDDIATVGWPKCGEIDVMEVVGKEPSNVYGTAHMPPLAGGGSVSEGGKHALVGAKIHEAYHVFAAEWEPEEIRWYFDDVLYKTFRKSETPASAAWVFDKPFHVLLNVAVGGRWPGYPDETTQFPQYMRVDYVRVYQRAPKPVLAAQRPVVNGASFLPGIAAGGWVSIFGTNLAAATREWWGGDFSGDTAPASLDGTAVRIDGKPACVSYISPTQLNVLAPEIGLGPVTVEVIRDGVSSGVVMAQADAFAPAFFLWQGRYAVATHSNWEPAAKAGLFADRATTPVRAGEWIHLWGSGFGPVDPPIPPGRLAAQAGKIATPHTVSVGSIPAELGTSVQSAGLVGVYQVPIRIPESLPPGDHAVVVEIAGRRSPEGVYLTVGQ